ncbi:MAG: UvrD-helicase domain-containing protein, partial [Bacilli bacterium]|nr:UvrD-helicase domain-containing protein [Bacilli bacterium]
MLSNLNEQQKAAVMATEGPVMVFAGAGTGKTRTLTYRVAYMVDVADIKPHNILAITFTNKATNEMKGRLLKLIGINYYAVTISTFHSFCAHILRREIPILGYSRYFTIIDEEEQLKIINQIVKENNLNKNDYSSKKIQKIINFCKCFDIPSADPIIVKTMELYEAKTHELNLLDFEDLLLKVDFLFANYPDILEKYTQQYQYVLVDEFQDTNLIQYRIMKMLTQKSRNFFVVGDDDQSIYSFRGANYHNIQLFKKDFPEHKIYFLTQNYRSTPIILNGCNRLIANNINREKKNLFSEINGSGDDVKIYQAYNEKLEANYVIDNILSYRLKGDPFSSFAVLARNSSLLRNIELNLMQMSVPYRVYGGISYFRRKEIKDIIAYFKLILNHEDIYSFSRIVNVPSRSIGEVTINKILEIKEKHQIDLFSAIDSCKSIIPSYRYQKLVEFKNIILEIADSMKTENLIDLYELLLVKTGYRKYLEIDIAEEDRLENIEEFKSVLYQYDEEFNNLSQREKLELAFDEAMLAEDKTLKSGNKDDAVILSTIHSAKGLEFKYVFVIGLEENVFPITYRQLSDEEMEEERRIAYVAFTRAQKRLYLINAQNRLLYGQRFINKPSRFMLEFQGIDFDKYQNNNITLTENAMIHEDALPSKTTNEYHTGDKVYHKIFGPGIIIAVQKDTAQIF